MASKSCHAVFYVGAADGTQLLMFVCVVSALPLSDDLWETACSQMICRRLRSQFLSAHCFMSGLLPGSIGTLAWMTCLKAIVEIGAGLIPTGDGFS